MRKTKGTLTEKDLVEMLNAIDRICNGKHIECNLMAGVCERCGMVGIKFPPKKKVRKV